MIKRPNPQAGNMFVYILGAIILLGILVALIRGNFQEGSGIDQEKILIQTTQVQRYTSELERGVGYIMQNGFSESDIRFAHADAHANYGLITDQPKRQVFSKEGGGVEYKAPPTGLNDGTAWQFYATTHIQNLGTDNHANSKAELMVVLPNVTEAFCARINFLNNHEFKPAVVTDTGACVNAGIGSAFNGTFLSGTNTNLINVPFINNPATEACVKCAGSFNYYRVLMAR